MRKLKVAALATVAVLTLAVGAPARADTVLVQKSWSWTGTGANGQSVTCTLTNRIVRTTIIDTFNWYEYADSRITCSARMGGVPSSSTGSSIRSGPMPRAPGRLTRPVRSIAVPVLAALAPTHEPARFGSSLGISIARTAAPSSALQGRQVVGRRWSAGPPSCWQPLVGFLRAPTAPTRDE